MRRETAQLIDFKLNWTAVVLNTICLPLQSLSLFDFPHSSSLHLAFWIASLLHSVRLPNFVTLYTLQTHRLFKMRSRTVTGALAFAFGLSDAFHLQDTPGFSPQSSSSCSDPSTISFAQSPSPCSGLLPNGYADLVTDLVLPQSLETGCTRTPRARQSLSLIKVSSSALIPLVVFSWKTQQHCQCCCRTSPNQYIPENSNSRPFTPVLPSV
jgi:hypothetical protein